MQLEIPPVCRATTDIRGTELLFIPNQTVELDIVKTVIGWLIEPIVFVVDALVTMSVPLDRLIALFVLKMPVLILSLIHI